MWLQNDCINYVTDSYASFNQYLLYDILLKLYKRHLISGGTCANQEP